jgi:hypothetical protein
MEVRHCFAVALLATGEFRTLSGCYGLQTGSALVHPGAAGR